MYTSQPRSASALLEQHEESEKHRQEAIIVTTEAERATKGP